MVEEFGSKHGSFVNGEDMSQSTTLPVGDASPLVRA